MSVISIQVIGVIPEYLTGVADLPGITVFETEMPFRDALRAAYSNAEKQPPPETGFIICCDDARVVPVSQRLAERGHPVILLSTIGQPPEVETPPNAAGQIVVADPAALASTSRHAFGLSTGTGTSYTLPDDEDEEYGDIVLESPPPAPGSLEPITLVPSPPPPAPAASAPPWEPAPAAAVAPVAPVASAPANPAPWDTSAPQPGAPVSPAPPPPADSPPWAAQPAPAAVPPTWQPEPAPVVGGAPWDTTAPAVAPAAPVAPSPIPPMPQPVPPAPSADPSDPSVAWEPATTAMGPPSAAGSTLQESGIGAYKTTATIHAFAVPKGGTGKTGLSLLYASTLGKGLREGLPKEAPGPRVVWIDGNPQQADGRYNFGVDPPRTIADIAEYGGVTEDTIEAYLLPPDPSAGRHMWVLAGPTSKKQADPSTITPNLYRRVTHMLAQKFEHIVIDTPEARLYDPQLATYVIPMTDWLLVPVIPDRGVVAGTQEWLQLIQAPKHSRGYGFDKNQVRLILNMARKDVKYGADEVQVEMARWQFAGEVPYSTAWAASKANYNLPFADKELQAALRQIAYEVTGSPLFKDAPRKRGIFASLGFKN